MIEDEPFPGGALEEVGRAAGARDVLALLSMLENPSFEVRVAAIGALGEVGGEQAKIGLVGVSKDRYGQRPEVRAAALRSLGRIFEPGRYADYLEEFIEGDSRKVIVVARGLLANADPTGFPSRLVKKGCLDHSAIKVYGRAGESSAVPLLGAFLAGLLDERKIASGSYWGKAHAAIKALGQIGGIQAANTLEDFASRLRAQEQETGGFLRRERMEKIEKAAEDSLAGL